jgi:aspartate aminotransferase-like enzyme
MGNTCREGHFVGATSSRRSELLLQAVRDALAPLDVPRRLLMGSGPSNPEWRVLQAMAAPVSAADDDSVFDELLQGVSELVRQVLQAAPEVTALAVPGASRSGLEAAIASTVRPGDRVLVGVYGHFGELLCMLAERHGGTVERVDAEWGDPVDAERMAARIREAPPRLAAIVHADTSTGVLQPLEPLGAACEATGTLLLVDAVLSLGGTEVAMQPCGADIIVSGLQKCLGGPPGLALVGLSSRAFNALNAGPDSAYLDLARLARLWQSPTTRTGAELPTPMLLAAREALRMVLEEGLAARWQRHAEASRALRAGIDAMGLQRFGNRGFQVPMITLVSVPDGIDEPGVRQQLLEEHGIEIMAAFGPLRGRVWRIGTMGTNASMPSVLAVLSGLEAVLASRGFGLSRGAALDAARQAFSRPLL